MKKLKNLKGANVLSRNEQKEVLGGNPPSGPCTDSYIVCTYVGNAGCPKGQGCFLEDDDPPVAYCLCL